MLRTRSPDSPTGPTGGCGGRFAVRAVDAVGSSPGSRGFVTRSDDGPEDGKRRDPHRAAALSDSY